MLGAQAKERSVWGRVYNTWHYFGKNRISCMCQGYHRGAAQELMVEKPSANLCEPCVERILNRASERKLKKVLKQAFHPPKIFYRKRVMRPLACSLCGRKIQIGEGCAWWSEDGEFKIGCLVCKPWPEGEEESP